MDAQSVESIVRALNDHSVRYLIAGGLAVIAHGYVRFTADVDIIILDEPNARRALEALSRLGYRPRAPVPMEQFADERTRDRWVSEKGMTVFSLHSERAPSTEVDLFVRNPVSFEKAYQNALRADVAPDVSATFLGYDDLVALKERAGRDQDLLDVKALRAIRETDK